MIINSLEQLGLSDCKQRFIVKNQFRSAAFTGNFWCKNLGVLDPNGDFKLGIADMEVLEEIPL